MKTNNYRPMPNWFFSHTVHRPLLYSLRLFGLVDTAISDFFQTECYFFVARTRRYKCKLYKRYFAIISLLDQSYFLLSMHCDWMSIEPTARIYNVHFISFYSFLKLSIKNWLSFFIKGFCFALLFYSLFVLLCAECILRVFSVFRMQFFRFTVWRIKICFLF